MLVSLQAQLKQHAPNQRAFLIGLSGGVDSVVLLHLFAHLRQSLPLSLRAVHIHHGISPNADQWQQFCQGVCAELNVPFLSEKVQVSGGNLEAQARTARYQAIGKLILPSEMLVTAHHQDDQAETVLLALKRGSGVKGLSAMQAVSFWQNFAIFRPLLSVSKAEILAYAEQQRLRWITDESNADNHYDRNFLRNTILPLLNERWQFSQMVARTAQHCTEQQALLEELLADELHARCDGGSLSIVGFQAFSPLKQKQLLRMWLAQANITMPTSAQLNQLVACAILAAQDKSPEIKLSDCWIRRYQQRLFICWHPPLVLTQQFELPAAPSAALELPCDLGILRRTATNIIYQKSTKIDRYTIPKALQQQPFRVQFQHQGKTARYGETHREEMKKIYQQHHIPVWQRRCTVLVFWQDYLLFVIPTYNP